MKNINNHKLFFLILIFTTCSFKLYSDCPTSDKNFLVYCVNPQKQNLKFYWKGENNKPIKSFSNLKNLLNKNNEKLIFATNGGMYKTDFSPLGLFISHGKILSRINKASASGNFYTKPNGVFYITKNNVAKISITEKFKNTTDINFATQSGPMLVIDGKIHKAFKKNSVNKNIRNGVGINSSGQIIFAMSKMPINLYDFAKFFLQSGCSMALYLDGYVSRTYLPSQNYTETDGNFGVIIAETKSN